MAQVSWSALCVLSSRLTFWTIKPVSWRCGRVLSTLMLCVFMEPPSMTTASASFRNSLSVR